MSKVLWECIPNVGSKARESAKAMNLAFVLLDFRLASTDICGEDGQVSDLYVTNRLKPLSNYISEMSACHSSPSCHRKCMWLYFYLGS